EGLADVAGRPRLPLHELAIIPDELSDEPSRATHTDEVPADAVADDRASRGAEAGPGGEGGSNRPSDIVDPDRLRRVADQDRAAVQQKAEYPKSDQRPAGKRNVRGSGVRARHAPPVCAKRVV